MKNQSFSNTVMTGDVFIINSGFSSSELFLNWDFGYDCTLPHKVTIDNFTVLPKNAYLFNDFPDICFENNYNLQLGITEEIIFKNMSAIIPTVRNLEFTKMNAIKVTIE
jgi:hypothetical protein